MFLSFSTGDWKLTIFVNLFGDASEQNRLRNHYHQTQSFYAKWLTVDSGTIQHRKREPLDLNGSVNYFTT